MATVAQVQAKLAQLTTDVSEQKTVITSLKTFLSGLGAIIASLRQELADAIAAGGNPAALQAVVDGMAALSTEVDGHTAEIAQAIQTPPA